MSEEEPLDPEIATTDRRGNDRRQNDRRNQSLPVAVDLRAGDDRRQQGERRKRIDPAVCERHYTPGEIEFMTNIDQYKRDNRRPFPTWSEVLQVLLALGYRKVAEREPLPGFEASQKASQNGHAL